MTTEKPPSKPKKAKGNSEESEVGYKNPPKDTRFEKGKSGNVKGRPKGSRNLIILFGEELDKQVVLQENGRQFKLSKREALVKRFVNQALNGDAKVMGTLIGMDKDNKDQDDKILELSPDDQEQYQRFLDRMTKGKIRQMEREKQKIEREKQKIEVAKK